MSAQPTGNTAIDNATPCLRAAYLGVYRVLDGPALSEEAAAELSRASSEIALAYSALTGQRIGEALGWATTA